jgi:hypothetical protein
MANERKPHFWIPDKEARRIPKELMGRQNKVIVPFKEHGTKLGRSLQTIEESFEKILPESSLRDKDVLVYNVALIKREKIQNRQDIFDANGMIIRAVRNEHDAVVTSTRSQFDALRRRVENYTGNGTNKTYFDYVDSLDPYIGSMKDSNGLQKTMLQEPPPQTVDVQFVLLPNLENNYYESAINNLKIKIEQTRGHIPEPVYYLSDRTPVVRAIIPSSTISQYENDPAIYRIEETSFFSSDTASIPIGNIAGIRLNPDVNIEELPIVAVLDSGVIFPTEFETLVVQHWTSPGSRGGDAEHGTQVAGNAVFRYIGQNIHNGVITPRVRIIDCNILDGNVSIRNFIKRIQDAVEAFGGIIKIFNLSVNSNIPIEGDSMSIIGYELDVLQRQRGIQFVVSAGNHELWRTQKSLADILDDDDSRISPPADSLYSLVVGSIVGKNHAGSLSLKNDIAPYSRKGPGFRGIFKPDLCAYAGTIKAASEIPADEFSLALTKNAMLAPNAGTSFSAPIIAGDLAEISAISPGTDMLLSKALLFHHAHPVWDDEDIDEEQLKFAHNLYGRGLSDVSESKYSSPSKVSFVRTGFLNRTTKERVTIYMPPILAAQTGRNVAMVRITCISAPPIDIQKGTGYLGAYIRLSLKKSAGDGIGLLDVSPAFKESREKWDVCRYISKPFSRFNAGDWQVWLELFGRWQNKSEDVRYALVVTIEDISRTLDIYSEIEAQERYRPLNELRVRFKN